MLTLLILVALGTSSPALGAVIPVRLVNGGSPLQGRLEARLGGRWGTVCSAGFTQAAAKVVCRQLWLAGGEVRPNAAYGAGSWLPILMDRVGCKGSEGELAACAFSTRPACRHSQDVGVKCTKPLVTALRLINGSSPLRGRLEVKVSGRWSTVCSRGFGPQEAQVACRQLGMSGGAAHAGARFGRGVVPAVLHAVACTGSETNLSKCKYSTIAPGCTHADDVSISCRPRLFSEVPFVVEMCPGAPLWAKPYCHAGATLDKAYCCGCRKVRANTWPLAWPGGHAPYEPYAYDSAPNCNAPASARLPLAPGQVLHYTGHTELGWSGNGCPAGDYAEIEMNATVAGGGTIVRTAWVPANQITFCQPRTCGQRAELGATCEGVGCCKVEAEGGSEAAVCFYPSGRHSECGVPPQGSPIEPRQHPCTLPAVPCMQEGGYPRYTAGWVCTDNRGVCSANCNPDGPDCWCESCDVFNRGYTRCPEGYVCKESEHPGDIFYPNYCVPA